MTRGLQGNLSDCDHTVYTTWTMSYKKLRPAAARLLDLCAGMHHDGLFEEIFSNAADNIRNLHGEAYLPVNEFLQTFQSADGEWDSFLFCDTLNEIMTFSLVDVDLENGVFSIHPLVHAWCHDRNPDANSTLLSSQIILAASISWSFSTADYAYRRMLLSHIRDASYIRKNLELGMHAVTVSRPGTVRGVRPRIPYR
jgi:hypothetical protein